MKEGHSMESRKEEAACYAGQKKDKKFLQTFTLTALLFIWAGYAFALCRGNDSKISGYSMLIVAFSLVNFNAMCGVEKIENKALNILARLDGILFFVWAAITIITIILK